jgi:hypothetical protein
LEKNTLERVFLHKEIRPQVLWLHSQPFAGSFANGSIASPPLAALLHLISMAIENTV